MPYDKSLRKKWTDAGYKSAMASACAVAPPPSHLIRVYHMTSTEFALSDLALGRIKLSRFSDSNDPFELLAYTFNDANSRRALRKFKEHYDSKSGLLCFSGNWSSPVLWSHYGARHRGICLGFDVPRSKALAVRYTNKRFRQQTLRLEGESNIDDTLREILVCTKFEHWNYEEEIRVETSLATALLEGKNYFCPFSDTLQLAEVILGPLCETPLAAARRLVTSLYPSAIVFQSRLAIDSFHIVPKESTIP